jgi:hypothetical protein
MFGLLTRPPRNRKPVARRNVSLCLERLEDRLTPSEPGLYHPPLLPPSETLSMIVTYDPGKYVTLTGQVTGTNIRGNQTIQFSGVVIGTTTTDMNGNYSATLKAQNLGSVTAVATGGLYCNPVTATLVSQVPTITNFKAINEGNGVWLFTGSVSGPPTQGEVVDFGGIGALQSTQVAVNSNGTFSFTAMVPIGGGGVAWAEAVDWWGDTSQGVTTNVTC